ncbi:hypothetical protein [Sporosarcina limicola]|uniref:Uncharacterized protein n=1 Tax=Sporosarcina limicola TaxID=34101 RepID=A0A927MNM1_9BACL|nr:hypothetical protein [Sporosarcina limicola]MBE1556432.1 hypothetical protein [Sporosarcina limicola]
MTTTTHTQYILYKPKKGITWDNYEINDFIVGLLEIIEKSNQYFLVIANILERYKNPDNDSSSQYVRNRDLEDIVIRYPEIKDNTEKTKELIQLLNSLYSMSSQSIGDIRGKVLEAIIYKYGPKNFAISADTVRCLEAIISYETENNILGINNSDFDFTYHDSNGITSSIPDYIECKATIDGSVQVGVPMSDLKPGKLKKWDYAKSIFESLKKNAGIEPNIYLACLNSHIADVQEHVNLEGYSCVTILNNKEIFRLIR